MYNQYLDSREFVQLEPEAASSPAAQQHSPSSAQRHAQSKSGPNPAENRPSDLLGEVTGGISQLLSGVLKHFSIENFDTGDILLVLIILFLFLEGDNLELVITLGLMLLLGLGDD